MTSRDVRRYLRDQKFWLLQVTCQSEDCCAGAATPKAREARKMKKRRKMQ
ncbi:hypothetical protein ACNKHO_15510 [Shigella flexneri]